MCLVLQLNCMQDSAEVGWELTPGYWGFLGEGFPFPSPPAWQPPHSPAGLGRTLYPLPAVLQISGLQEQTKINDGQPETDRWTETRWSAAALGHLGVTSHSVIADSCCR